MQRQPTQPSSTAALHTQLSNTPTDGLPLQNVLTKEEWDDLQKIVDNSTTTLPNYEKPFALIKKLFQAAITIEQNHNQAMDQVETQQRMIGKSITDLQNTCNQLDAIVERQKRDLENNRNEITALQQQIQQLRKNAETVTAQPPVIKTADNKNPAGISAKTMVDLPLNFTSDKLQLQNEFTVAEWNDLKKIVDGSITLLPNNSTTIDLIKKLNQATVRIEQRHHQIMHEISKQAQPVMDRIKALHTKLIASNELIEKQKKQLQESGVEIARLKQELEQLRKSVVATTHDAQNGYVPMAEAFDSQRLLKRHIATLELGIFAQEQLAMHAVKGVMAKLNRDQWIAGVYVLFEAQTTRAFFEKFATYLHGNRATGGVNVLVNVSQRMLAVQLFDKNNQANEPPKQHLLIKVATDGRFIITSTPAKRQFNQSTAASAPAIVTAQAKK